MIPVPAHIILQSKRDKTQEKEELDRQGETDHGRERGAEGAKREEWGWKAEGVNVYIINLDYLGDRAATSPGALETAGQVFAGSL